jgi:sulfoxide reductase heme-binding subunit YedZ
VKARRKLTERGVRIAVFVLSLVPLALLVGDALTGGLGANPIENITRRTGWWTLTFLMLTLAVTPVRRLTGVGWLIKLRRMLGLYAFFYASLHFAIYIGIDQFFALEYIVEDIMDRPYITVGFAGLVLLVPLALTSTKKMVKRLGGRRWNRLHKAVYLTAAFGVLHFLWLVKADMREPTIFGLILVTLLSYRLAAQRLRLAGARTNKPQVVRSVIKRRSATAESGVASS